VDRRALNPLMRPLDRFEGVRIVTPATFSPA
jgi:hypothetical protein